MKTLCKIRMKPQFIVRWLLATIVVGAASADFGWLGSVTAIIALGGVVGATLHIFAASSPLRGATEVGAVALLLAVLVAVILPMFNFSSEWSRQSQCEGQLWGISRALLNYHRAHGSFPPACDRDEAGRPMHSWRVLILPYMGLEERELYSRYDLNEPWNSPGNRKLAALRPKIYACPSDADTALSANTSYMAVVGRETVWPDSGAMKLDDIRDKPNETIQLVEVAGSGVNWMEPRDLPFDAAVAGINQPSGLSISSNHTVLTDLIYRETGANVVFCDSTGGFLSQDISSDALRALLTANGGEVVSGGMLDARRVNWPRCLSISVMAISVILLLASFANPGRKSDCLDC